MGEKGNEYDMAKRTKAQNFAVLRTVVAAYLAWLGFSLIRDHLRGASTLPPVLVWVAGPGFIAAALAFGLYAWKLWKRELDAAKLLPSEADAGAPDSEQE